MSCKFFSERIYYIICLPVQFSIIYTNWKLARRAGGQVVRKICVIVFALRRSVSFYFVGDGFLSPGIRKLVWDGTGNPSPTKPLWSAR